MKRAFKVARWEIKKTITNKTFLISVLVTPILFMAFALIPALLASVESARPYNLHVIDEIGIFEKFEGNFNSERININLSNNSFEQLSEEIMHDSRAGFIIFQNDSLMNGNFTIYVGGDARPNLIPVQTAIQKTFREELLKLGEVPEEASERIVSGYSFTAVSLIEDDEDLMEKFIPGIFAAFVLFGVFITGTMIFQSAIQEKKDRVSEILLSSITAEDLMKGKIIGFFAIGLFQISVWMFFAFLILLSIGSANLLLYLLTPKLLILLFYAFAGYLLYASLFISMGATIDDIGTSGNFQSIIVMIPLLPLFFIAAIITDPNGLIAQIGSYIPFTTPGVMLFRLSISDQVPLIEIMLTIGIMIVSIWLMMKIAGKIFKVGILKFGKNASLGDIWKWIKLKE